MSVFKREFTRVYSDGGGLNILCWTFCFSHLQAYFKQK